MTSKNQFNFNVSFKKRKKRDNNYCTKSAYQIEGLFQTIRGLMKMRQACIFTLVIRNKLSITVESNTVNVLCIVLYILLQKHDIYNCVVI